MVTFFLVTHRGSFLRFHAASFIAAIERCSCPLRKGRTPSIRHYFRWKTHASHHCKVSVRAMTLKILSEGLGVAVYRDKIYWQDVSEFRGFKSSNFFFTFFSSFFLSHLSLVSLRCCHEAAPSPQGFNAKNTWGQDSVTHETKRLQALIWTHVLRD